MVISLSKSNKKLFEEQPMFHIKIASRSLCMSPIVKPCAFQYFSLNPPQTSSTDARQLCITSRFTNMKDFTLSPNRTKLIHRPVRSHMVLNRKSRREARSYTHLLLRMKSSIIISRETPRAESKRAVIPPVRSLPSVQCKHTGWCAESLARRMNLATAPSAKPGSSISRSTQRSVSSSSRGRAKNSVDGRQTRSFIISLIFGIFRFLSSS
mmetsp:Transcript_2271/g.3811  ORF Transcript_2271/g.3811 Transcript_2271/m.3811 type:complete len:210 (-) Transcript_2271:634-1263(-)